jgi:DNA-binding NtrC family response regulator
MTNNHVKVLLIEEIGDICNLLRELLMRDKSAIFILKSVNKLEEGLNFIKENELNLIFLDITPSDSSTMDILSKLFYMACDIPVIILSDIYDEKIATHVLSMGAQDYLLKQELNSRLLSRSIRYALERNKIRIELNDTVDKLNKALENIKTLNGLLPICAQCKRIRDDEGYWQQIEKYFTERSDVEFSHGICPNCIKKLYPEFAESMAKKKK